MKRTLEHHKQFLKVEQDPMPLCNDSMVILPSYTYLSQCSLNLLPNANIKYLYK